MRKPVHQAPNMGSLISPADSGLLSEAELPQLDQGRPYIDPANPLWEYHKQGTIDGFKVADDDIGLPIETADMLAMAMVPHMEPSSEILVISPDDSKGLDRYNELNRLEAAKEIVVQSESSQYDGAKSAYVTWIKYSRVEYRLAPRFDYLREGRDGDR